MNIKRNKIPQKTRLFSSKNRNSSMKNLPLSNRPRTGISRKIDYMFKKKPSKKNKSSKINFKYIY